MRYTFIILSIVLLGTSLACRKATGDDEAVDLVGASVAVTVSGDQPATGTNVTVSTSANGDSSVEITGTDGSEVGTIPGLFVITGPSGDISDSTPLISWDSSPDATSYAVKIAADAGCAAVEASKSTTALNWELTTPLLDDDYYICVTASNEEGSVVASNDGLSFTVDTIAPSAFAIDGPTSPTNSSKPMITWSASAGADGYNLFVDTDSQCNSPHDYSVTAVTVNYHKAVSAIADGSYYICVLAFDDAGNATSAAAYPVIIDTAPPGGFNITAPSSDTNDVTPTITWTASSGVDGYDLVLDTDGACEAPYVEAQADIAGTSYTVTTTLSNAVTYYACVTAKDLVGNKTDATNNAMSFLVDTAAPGAFNITGPTDPTSDSTPTVVWSGATGATSYDVKVDNNSDCSSPAESANGVSGLSHVVAATLSDGTYYVCVTSSDDATNTTDASNSGTYSFTLDTVDPGAFSVTGPLIATNDTTPNITWGASSGSLNYDIKVDNNADCSSPADSKVDHSGTSYTVASALTPGVTYYVCMTAFDAADNSVDAANSGTFQFDVDTTPPGAFSVTGPATLTLDTTPDVTWGVSAGASKYDIAVDDNSSCATPVDSASNQSGTSYTVASALGDGTYYACVTAKDDAGNSVGATNNGSYTFVVDTTPPEVFVIDGPTSPTGDTTPTISWAASTGATKYDVDLDDVADCSSPIESSTDEVGTSYDVTTTLTNGNTYYVCVTAKDNLGMTRDATNNGYSFLVDNSAPQGFSITAPANNATNDTTPTLTWGSSTGATKYDVKLDDVSDCSSPIESSIDLVATSFDITTTLTNGNTYYVCVVAKDDAANSTDAANSPYTLLVDTSPPGAFSVTGPSSPTNDTTPDVTWGASTGASTYDVKVDNNADCSSPEDSAVDLATTSHTVSSALSDGTYYVCVTAKDTATNSTDATNSGSYSFVVDETPPGAFNVTGPGTPTNDTTPDITWSAATGAATYDVIVDDNSNCLTPADSSTGEVGLSYTVSSALSNGTTYYVCITAKDAAGNPTVATNNGTYQFNVDTTPPGSFTVTGPSAMTNDTTPDVVWSASSEAISYDVVVDDNSDCATPVDSSSGETGLSYTVSFALTNGTTYYVCLTAKDSATNTIDATNSGAFSFTVDTTPPGAFSIAGPVAETNDTTPDVTWGASAGSSTYDIIVDDNSNCLSPFDSKVDHSGTSYTVATPLNQTTYYVCVTAKDAAGNTTGASNSGTYSFLVDTTPPGAFTITSPTANAQLSDSTPTIVFGAASGATKYDIKVDDGATCASAEDSAIDHGSTSYTTAALGDNDYYVCVTAKDNAGNTTDATNSALQFTIDTVAPILPEMTKTTPLSPSSVNSPTIDGTAEANSSVEVFTDITCSTSAGTDTADGSGNFAANVTVSDRVPKTYWAKATDAASNVSNCSSTNIGYEAYPIATGIAWVSGTGTTFSTNVNDATAYPLSWNSAEFDADYFSHSYVTNPERLVVEGAGDYFVAVSLPVTGTVARSNVMAEVYVDGVAVPGALGLSSYIRASSGVHLESSDNFSALLEGLVQGNYIEVKVSGIAAAGTVTVMEQASLYAEFVGASRTLFSAKATETTLGTDINLAAAPLIWTSSIAESGFTHSSPHQSISLDAAGDYLVYANLPQEGVTQRSSTALSIKTAGTEVTGGRASQGYIRAGSTAVHNESSVHWSGLVRGVSASDALTIDTIALAAAGTVTALTGKEASVFVEKVDTSSGFFSAEATELTTGTDWNTAGGDTVKWNTNVLKDATFTHDTVTNPHEITVNTDGDYLLIYNDSIQATSARVNTVVTISINGTPLSGSRMASHYIRNNGGHENSSGTLVFLLRELNSGDKVSISSIKETGGAAGTVSTDQSAIVTIWYKGGP